MHGHKTHIELFSSLSVWVWFFFSFLHIKKSQTNRTKHSQSLYVQAIQNFVIGGKRLFILLLLLLLRTMSILYRLLFSNLPFLNEITMIRTLDKQIATKNYIFAHIALRAVAPIK